MLFEKLAAPTETKPPVEMISLENLVALASTPQDLFETEFEAPQKKGRNGWFSWKSSEIKFANLEVEL